MFDFGAVCAGLLLRLRPHVVCGEPHPEYERVYEIMLAAQEAGRAAAVPGALAREVNAACRAPIEEAGLGAHFRHRMGHGIGARRARAAVHLGGGHDAARGGHDVHRRALDPLGRPFAVRIEDVVVCAEGGGRRLNEHSREAVINR